METNRILVAGEIDDLQKSLIVPIVDNLRKRVFGKITVLFSTDDSIYIHIERGAMRFVYSESNVHIIFSDGTMDTRKLCDSCIKDYTKYIMHEYLK